MAHPGDGGCKGVVGEKGLLAGMDLVLFCCWRGTGLGMQRQWPAESREGVWRRHSVVDTKHCPQVKTH